MGRTDAEAPILWPPNAKSWLTGKDPDVGKDWRQEKKTTEHEMMMDGITNSMDMSSGDGKGLGILACCSPWGCRVRHTWVTENELSPHIGQNGYQQQFTSTKCWKWQSKSVRQIIYKMKKKKCTGKICFSRLLPYRNICKTMNANSSVHCRCRCVENGTPLHCLWECKFHS